MDKNQKIKMVVELYVNNPGISIEQISNITSISSSSVQRYLNDPLIPSMFDSDYVAKLNAIKVENSISAKRKGGINFFKNNIALKDENGKFIGSKQHEGSSDRLADKLKVLQMLFNFIKNGSCNSVEELTHLYNSFVSDDQKITVYYVYDCITSPYVSDILGDDGVNYIRDWLLNNQKIGNKNGADVVNSRQVG